MSKFVAGAFKTIFLTMLVIFAFDMIAYVIKFRTLNQSMLNTMNNMQKTVQTENGMSDSMYKMYKAIFDGYKAKMHDDHTGLGDFIITSGSDAVRLNYGRDADSAEFTEGGIFPHANEGVNNLTSAFTTSSNNTIIKDMSKYGGLGDMTIIRAQVIVQSPLWAFTGSRDGGSDAQGTSGAKYGKGLSAFAWNRVKASKMQLNYMYVVPCTHYQKITE